MFHEPKLIFELQNLKRISRTLFFFFFVFLFENGFQTVQSKKNTQQFKELWSVYKQIRNTYIHTHTHTHKVSSVYYVHILNWHLKIFLVQLFRDYFEKRLNKAPVIVIFFFFFYFGFIEIILQISLPPTGVFRLHMYLVLETSNKYSKI